MKKLIATCFLSGLLIACGNTTTKEETPIEIPENNVELVKHYFYYFNNHEWNKMADMYADTIVFKDPSFGVGKVFETKTETSKKYSELHKLFPDIRDEIIDIYPTTKDAVVVEFISTGTAPNGNSFELPICTIFTFKNGKIIADYTYYDN